MSAFVQCLNVQSGGATSLSKSITTTAGNSVIAVLCFSAPKATVGTITQSSGDTTSATAAENVDATNGWYTATRVARNVAGGATTFTFSWTSGGNAMMFLVETAPLLPTPLDVFATEASSVATTHLVGPTAAIADATELAIAIWNADASASNTPSVDSSFTIPNVGATTGGNVMGSAVTDCRAALAYLDCTSAPSVTLTSTASITAHGLLATFRTNVVFVPRNTYQAPILTQ